MVSFIAPHSLTARALVVAPDDLLTVHNRSRGHRRRVDRRASGRRARRGSDGPDRLPARGRGSRAAPGSDVLPAPARHVRPARLVVDPARRARPVAILEGVREAAALYHGRIGRLTLAVALCCSLGAAWAQAASAYTPAGDAARPHGEDHVLERDGLHDELAAAVRAWNTSGARVRFVKARRSRARVRITLTEPVNDGGFGASGVASLGFGRGTFVKVSRGSSGAALTGVLAHELGHVLGLGHEDGVCATMNSVPWSLCGAQKPCTILDPDDVRGAIHRYGGRLRKGRSELCPPAPVVPGIEFVPGSYRAQVRFEDAQGPERRRLRRSGRCRRVPGQRALRAALDDRARGSGRDRRRHAGARTRTAPRAS